MSAANQCPTTVVNINVATTTATTASATASTATAAAIGQPPPNRRAALKATAAIAKIVESERIPTTEEYMNSVMPPPPPPIYELPKQQKVVYVTVGNVFTGKQWCHPTYCQTVDSLISELVHKTSVWPQEGKERVPVVYELRGTRIPGQTSVEHGMVFQLAINPPAQIPMSSLNNEAEYCGWIYTQYIHPHRMTGYVTNNLKHPKSQSHCQVCCREITSSVYRCESCMFNCCPSCARSGQHLPSAVNSTDEFMTRIARREISDEFGVNISTTTNKQKLRTAINEVEQQIRNQSILELIDDTSLDIHTEEKNLNRQKVVNVPVATTTSSMDVRETAVQGSNLNQTAAAASPVPVPQPVKRPIAHDSAVCTVIGTWPMADVAVSRPSITTSSAILVRPAPPTTVTAVPVRPTPPTAVSARPLPTAIAVQPQPTATSVPVRPAPTAVSARPAPTRPPTTAISFAQPPSSASPSAAMDVKSIVAPSKPVDIYWRDTRNRWWHAEPVVPQPMNSKPMQSVEPFSTAAEYVTLLYRHLHNRLTVTSSNVVWQLLNSYFNRKMDQRLYHEIIHGMQMICEENKAEKLLLHQVLQTVHIAYHNDRRAFATKTAVATASAAAAVTSTVHASSYPHNRPPTSISHNRLPTIAETAAASATTAASAATQVQQPASAATQVQQPASAATQVQRPASVTQIQQPTIIVAPPGGASFNAFSQQPFTSSWSSAVSVGSASTTSFPPVNKLWTSTSSSSIDLPSLQQYFNQVNEDIKERVSLGVPDPSMEVDDAGLYGCELPAPLTQHQASEIEAELEAEEEEILKKLKTDKSYAKKMREDQEAAAEGHSLIMCCNGNDFIGVARDFAETATYAQMRGWLITDHSKVIMNEFEIDEIEAAIDDLFNNKTIKSKGKIIHIHFSGHGNKFGSWRCVKDGKYAYYRFGMLWSAWLKSSAAAAGSRLLLTLDNCQSGVWVIECKKKDREICILAATEGRRPTAGYGYTPVLMKFATSLEQCRVKQLVDSPSYLTQRQNAVAELYKLFPIYRPTPSAWCYYSSRGEYMPVVPILTETKEFIPQPVTPEITKQLGQISLSASNAITTSAATTTSAASAAAEATAPITVKSEQSPPPASSAAAAASANSSSAAATSSSSQHNARGLLYKLSLLKARLSAVNLIPNPSFNTNPSHIPPTNHN